MNESQEIVLNTNKSFETFLPHDSNISENNFHLLSIFHWKSLP